MQVDKVVPSHELNKYNIFISFILESDGPGISNVILSDCVISTKLLNELLDFNNNISEKFSYKNPSFYQQLYLPSDLGSDHTALFIKMYFNTLLKECKGEHDELYIYIKHFLLPDYKAPSPSPENKFNIRASLSYLSRFPDDLTASFKQSPRRSSCCTPPGEISDLDVLRSTMGSNKDIYHAVRAEHLNSINNGVVGRPKGSFNVKSSISTSSVNTHHSHLPRHSPIPEFTSLIESPQNSPRMRQSSPSSENSPHLSSVRAPPLIEVDQEEIVQVRNTAKSIVDSPQMRTIYNKQRISLEKVSSPVKKVPTFVSVAAITPRNVVTNIVNNSLISNSSLPFKPSNSNPLFAPISPPISEKKDPQPPKKGFFFF